MRVRVSVWSYWWTSNPINKGNSIDLSVLFTFMWVLSVVMWLPIKSMLSCLCFTMFLLCSCVFTSLEYALRPTTGLELGRAEAISIKTVRKNLWFICLSQLRFLMLQLFRWTQNWQDLFFFSCHLHLCSWHHSYWSKSVSISAVFCCNAFQISWCFKYFFFNLASKHMEHLWSPGIIQIWSTLGFLRLTLQSDAFEALGKIWDICINYFITPKIYVVIYSQN